MPSIYLFYAFLIALLTTLLLIPSVSRLAVSIGVLDRSGEDRKVHTNDTPRLGGFAIFFAFLLAAILCSTFDLTIKGFLTGSLIIFLTGLADDLTGLTPRQKFLGQLIAVGTSVLIGGKYLTSLGDLFGFGEILLGPLAIPFTIVAIAGVINAVNLLDGLDGLAGGASAIAGAFFFFLAYHTHNEPLQMMIICFLGAVFGFLRFNTYPAKIFMGDSGSLFLGYCLGFFAVMIVVGSKGHISTMTPVVILAVPIIDTLFVMSNRARAGQKLFSPDRRHLHHRLLGLSFKHQVVVTGMYGLTYFLGFIAFFTHDLPSWQLFYGLAGFFVLLYLILNRVERIERLRTVGKYQFRVSIFSGMKRESLYLAEKYLNITMKYLLLVTLLLTVIIPLPQHNQIAMVAIVLLLLSQGFIFMSDDRSNRYLLFLININSAYVIYCTENFAHGFDIFGVHFLMVSDVLFSLLFIIALIKLLIKGAPLSFLDTPLEYLILFLVISVPLLPEPLRREHQLLAVAGKSIVLFIAYKLVLMEQARQNKKIIVANFAALTYVGIRFFI